MGVAAAILFPLFIPFIPAYIILQAITNPEGAKEYLAFLARELPSVFTAEFWQFALQNIQDMIIAIINDL